MPAVHWGGWQRKHSKRLETSSGSEPRIRRKLTGTLKRMSGYWNIFNGRPGTIEAPRNVRAYILGWTSDILHQHRTKLNCSCINFKTWNWQDATDEPHETINITECTSHKWLAIGQNMVGKSVRPNVVLFWKRCKGRHRVLGKRFEAILNSRRLTTHTVVNGWLLGILLVLCQYSTFFWSLMWPASIHCVL